MPNFSHYINQKSDFYLKVRYSDYVKNIFQIVNNELVMDNHNFYLATKEVFTIYKRRIFFFDKEIDTFVCDRDEIHQKVKEKMFKINRNDKLKNLLND